MNQTPEPVTHAGLMATFIRNEEGYAFDVTDADHPAGERLLRSHRWGTAEAAVASARRVLRALAGSPIAGENLEEAA